MLSSKQGAAAPTVAPVRLRGATQRRQRSMAARAVAAPPKADAVKSRLNNKDLVQTTYNQGNKWAEPLPETYEVQFRILLFALTPFRQAQRAHSGCSSRSPSSWLCEACGCARPLLT